MKRGEELSGSLLKRINYCSRLAVLKLKMNLSCLQVGLPVTAPDIVNNVLIDAYFSFYNNINLSHSSVRLSAYQFSNDVAHSHNVV